MGDRVEAPRKQLYWRNWSTRSTSKNLGLDSPNFLAIWRQILDGSCSTAAIMDVHIVSSWSAFYTSFLTDILLQSSTHFSVWMTSTRITKGGFPCISTGLTITRSGLKGCYEDCPEYSSGVHSAVRCPCCECVSDTSNNALHGLKECYPSSQRSASQYINVTGHVFKIFDLFVLTKNHTIGSSVQPSCYTGVTLMTYYPSLGFEVQQVTVATVHYKLAIY